MYTRRRGLGLLGHGRIRTLNAPLHIITSSLSEILTARTTMAVLVWI